MLIKPTSPFTVLRMCVLWMASSRWQHAYIIIFTLVAPLAWWLESDEGTGEGARLHSYAGERFAHP